MPNILVVEDDQQNRIQQRQKKSDEKCPHYDGDLPDYHASGHYQYNWKWKMCIRDRAAADELAVCVSDDADNLSLQRLRLGAARKALAAAGQYLSLIHI